MGYNRCFISLIVIVSLFLTTHQFEEVEGFGGGSNHFRDIDAGIVNITQDVNDKGEKISFVNIIIKGNYTSDLENQHKDGINISCNEIIRTICHPSLIASFSAGDNVIVNISRISNYIVSWNQTVYSWQLISIQMKDTQLHGEDVIESQEDTRKEQSSLGMVEILSSIIFVVFLFKRK